MQGLKAKHPYLFADLNGGFPANYDAVRHFVEETDDEVRSSPLKKRRLSAADADEDKEAGKAREGEERKQRQGEERAAEEDERQAEHAD